MQNVRFAVVAVLCGVAGAAHAEVSSTWTATNDYDFRGITQSDEDPALQASLDFANDTGWYIGAWASNVDFPGYDGEIEVDLYTGFTGETEAGLGWDVGIIYYMYPGSDEGEPHPLTGVPVEGELLEFPEIYGGLSMGPVEGKLWYSNDFGGTDESSIYAEVNGTFEVGSSGVSILAHLGYSDGDAIDALFGDSYMDYSAGVGYTLSNFDLGLKYVDTDIDGDLYEDRVIFTVSTTFPWSSD